MSVYEWRCICGASGKGETGKAGAREHSRVCPKFGWPNTNPYMEKEQKR